jgi:hypothetical protein
MDLPRKSGDASLRCAQIVGSLQRASEAGWSSKTQDLWTPERDDEPAGDNERAADENRHVWPDVEENQIDDLCDGEEQRQIDPKQFAKIPRREIDCHPIGKQNYRSSSEEADAGCHAGTVKPDADEGITASFKRSGQQQQEIGCDKVHGCTLP